MQVGVTYRLLYVFFGGGLQAVMVLALVGVRRVFKVFFNKVLMPFGFASMLIKILFGVVYGAVGFGGSLAGLVISVVLVQAGCTYKLKGVFFGVVLVAVGFSERAGLNVIHYYLFYSLFFFYIYVLILRRWHGRHVPPGVGDAVVTASGERGLPGLNTPFAASMLVQLFLYPFLCWTLRFGVF